LIPNGVAAENEPAVVKLIVSEQDSIDYTKGPHGYVRSYDKSRGILTIDKCTEVHSLLLSYNGNSGNMQTENGYNIKHEQSYDIGKGQILIGKTSKSKTRILNMVRGSGAIETSGVARFKPEFDSASGILSNLGSLLQDSKKIHDYAIKIKTGMSLNQYETALKNLVHPAGYKMFGEILVSLFGNSGIKDFPTNDRGLKAEENVYVLLYSLFASIIQSTHKNYRIQSINKLFVGELLGYHIEDGANKNISIMHDGIDYEAYKSRFNVASAYTWAQKKINVSTFGTLTLTRIDDTVGKISRSDGSWIADGFGYNDTKLFIETATKTYYFDVYSDETYQTGGNDGKDIYVKIGTEFVDYLSASNTNIVKSINVIDGGEGYTEAPTITTTGGSGLTASFDIVDGSIKSVDVIDGGSGYYYGMNLSVTQGTGVSVGSGAKLIPVIGDTYKSNGQIDKEATILTVRVEDCGSGYSLGNQISVIGMGKGFSATLTIINGKIRKVNIVNPGSGYYYGASFVINAGTASGGAVGTGAILTPIIKDGRITKVYVENDGFGNVGGSGYVSGNTISVLQTVTDAATLSISKISDGVIRSVSVTDDGTNYSSNDDITVSGGGIGHKDAVLSLSVEDDKFTTLTTATLGTVTTVYGYRHIESA
jgi:hypothetical protein